MKKFILGFIIGALLFSFAGVFAAVELNVIPNPFPVLIDGVKTEIEGYNINGSTYLKLRDFEKAGLGIDFVDKQVVITTKKEIVGEIAKEVDNVEEVELLESIGDITKHDNGEETFVCSGAKYITGPSLYSLIYKTKKYRLHANDKISRIIDLETNKTILDNIPFKFFKHEGDNIFVCYEYNYYLNIILPLNVTAKIILGKVALYEINGKEYSELSDLAWHINSKYPGYSLNSNNRTNEISLTMPNNEIINNIPYITVKQQKYIEKDYFFNKLLPLIEQEAE